VNGDKDGKFKEFLDTLDPRAKRDVNEELDAAKNKGLPIEDTV
jgi:hypothetical protein